jgi:hypothetical protein
MITWQRIAYHLGLALVEATPPALLLTLAGGGAWISLIGVVLAGALADWIILRRIRPERQGIALIVVGLLCALWLVKSQVVGDYGLLGDWGQALGTIFSISHPRAAVAYLSLLAALYCFWRGTRLTLHDSVSLHRLFRTAAIGLLLIVGLTIFGAGRAATIAVLASTEVLTFFAVGLVTIALASAIEHRDVELRILDWRGMLTLCGAIALVLVLGVLIGSLFGGAAGQVARGVVQAVVLIIALILSPLLLLIAKLLEWLINVAHLDQMLRQLVQQLQLQNQAPPPQTTGILAIFPAWVQAAIRIFFALLPVLLIVGLLLLARSRARHKRADDGERESLWSWGGLADDLRGLLAGLRTPRRDEGLRAALARLRGGDPASRVRRSYIRLLLLGEAHSLPRAAPQTPREYAPTAGAMLPVAAQPVAALTDAYERARYFPQGTTDADAAAAERMWEAIEQAERRST